MNFTVISAAAPEITLLIMICVVLIADLFIKDENRVGYVLAQPDHHWPLPPGHLMVDGTGRPDPAI